MFKSSLAAEVMNVMEVRITQLESEVMNGMEVRITQLEDKITILLDKIEEMKTSNAVLAALKQALK